ncbi:Nn.00g085630.m01.CDS01 [Neocucurbitaria sp. VM-36]
MSCDSLNLVSFLDPSPPQKAMLQWTIGYLFTSSLGNLSVRASFDLWEVNLSLLVLAALPGNIFGWLSRAALDKGSVMRDKLFPPESRWLTVHSAVNGGRGCTAISSLSEVVVVTRWEVKSDSGFPSRLLVSFSSETAKRSSTARLNALSS